MNYAELLSSYISKSSMSLSQITDELKEKGYSSHKGYISKLQNGKLPPAGEDLNRALAEVTGGDAQKLIWAAYLEKIPEDMKEFFTALDGSVIESAVELEKKFPGFLQGHFELNPAIRESKEFQRLKTNIENWGFVFGGFWDQNEITNRTESNKYENKDPLLFKSFLNNAKGILDSCHSSPEDQVMIRSAVLMAFTAFELRLNEVLLKAIKIDGTSTEIGLDYLNELTLSGKLRTPLEQHLGYEITKEPFFLNLRGAIALKNKIAHNAVSEAITTNTVKDVITAVEAVIASLNEHAKQKGIE